MTTSTRRIPGRHRRHPARFLLVVVSAALVASWVAQARRRAVERHLAEFHDQYGPTT